jgi:starch phosphorylase
MNWYGDRDVSAAAQGLAARLPEPLGVFARLALNYRWSWSAEGPALFRAVDHYRWEACRENPVRLLMEASAESLVHAAKDQELLERARDLEDRFIAEQSSPDAPLGVGGPIAFFCAEYGIHRSLPTYSGGLGILAGDILKEASDQALPMVAVGILYRQGYFHQNIDTAGWQHEFWIESDPDRLPTALVTDHHGIPLTVKVPLRGRDVILQIWRVDVGRVPLYLLDAQRPENSRIDRWITARLYVGDRKIRLAQYALLGVGSIRAFEAMGIRPGVMHMNEGHAALAPIELARRLVAGGMNLDEAREMARSRTVFTTHTPVAAGNETYTAAEIWEAVDDYPLELGVGAERFLDLGRVRPGNPEEPFGLTPLALRMSRHANAVSRVHGQVARDMWHPMYPDLREDKVPIGHVTNGVHLPTWMSAPMRELLDRHLGEEWMSRTADPATWEPVADIPNAELWGVRTKLRSSLVTWARDRTVGDRLARGEPIDYAESAAAAFNPEALTLGFARRVAVYKRVFLLIHDVERARRLLDTDHPVQLLLAGKAHPQDFEAKRILQTVFSMKLDPLISERAAYLEDYDMGMASHLVQGCDVWINVPRAPLEASGTSGMKSALNGGLNLSVLDGWWEEAFDGTNGWGIQAITTHDQAGGDARDAEALYSLLENEVIPQFNQRNADGVPISWVERIKRALITIGPRFCATRMVREYVTDVYAPSPVPASVSSAAEDAAS